jgi:hypothetical protein
MYLDKDPSILYSNDTSSIKIRTSKLLKNGKLLDLRIIEVDNKLYNVTYTYTFNSIVQIICSSYVDSDIYVEWLNINSSNTLIKLFIDAIRDDIIS